MPRPISRLWPLGVIQVAGGQRHSAALLADGRLLTWGFGRYGQLGVGDFEGRSTPQLVRALVGVHGCQVCCGDDHTCLLADDGSVYTWGRCHFIGVLSGNKVNEKMSCAQGPELQPGLQGQGWPAYTPPTSHTAGCRGTWGQTGHAHTENTCYPQKVAALQGHHIVQVAAGGRHTLALSADNRLWAFGNNESGQLSTPADAAQPRPQLVQGLPPGCPILFMAAGGDTSLVVLDRHASVEASTVGELSAVHDVPCCAVLC